MRRENGDRLLHYEMGYNARTLEKWHQQGLPKEILVPELFGVAPTPDLFDYMNICSFAMCQFEQYYLPPFPSEIIERREISAVIRDGRGNIMEHRTDGEGSLPLGIEFAIKTQKDYLGRRHRIVGGGGARASDEYLEEIRRTARDQQDHIVGLWVHGPFAFLRELLGVEGAMTAPYDEPEMVRMMLDDHLQVAMDAGARVADAVHPDCSYVWEDCSGSTGPFISPPIFREFCLPWYRKWKRFLLDIDVPWMVMDTDGNPTPLVGLWMEGGVDCILPWEVNAVDILEIAEDFPTLNLMGGIYKHVFEPGSLTQVGRFETADTRREIDIELERVVKPLRKRGGYVAGLDHAVHRGVGYRDFEYYCRRLSERYGKANRSTRFAQLRDPVPRRNPGQEENP
jgi:uroporphyrinogen decarboxylase